MDGAPEDLRESTALRPADWGERDAAPIDEPKSVIRSVSVPPVSRLLPSEMPTWETLPNVIPSKFFLSAPFPLLPSHIFDTDSRRASSVGAIGLSTITEEPDSQSSGSRLFQPGERVLATMNENNE